MITSLVTRIIAVIAIIVEVVGFLRHFLDHSHAAIRAEQDSCTIISKHAPANGRRLANIAKKLHRLCSPGFQAVLKSAALILK